MSLNCREIEEIIKYIKIPAIIENLFHIDEYSILIHTIHNELSQNIIVSVKDNFNRILILPKNEKIETFDMRFSQFLNANIKFSLIKNVYQLEYSRVVIFEIESRKNNFKLVARLWGVAGNILLLDSNNIILECLKRYPKRNEWINNKFIFPQNEKKGIYKINSIFQDKNSEIDNDKVYFYYKEKIVNEKFNNSKMILIKFFKKEIDKIKNEITDLTKLLHENEETNLKIGELIKAFCYQIKKGDKNIKLFDYETEKEIEIDLNPDLSPIENAEKYFNRYRKIKETKKINEERIILLKDRLKKFQNIYNEIENTTLQQFQLLEKLKEEIFIKKEKKDNNERALGRSFILSDGYKAIVSKNAKNASEILNRIAKGNDYWFHIRDYAGSHVIVPYIKNREITEKVKLEAAHLAFYYSKANRVNKITEGEEGDIYFTQVKYLHKSNSKTVGMVIPIKEKNIKLKFNKKIIEEIFYKNKKLF